MAQRKQIQLVSMRMQVQSLALLSGLRIRHCCGVGHRHSLDPGWLWVQLQLDLTRENPIPLGGGPKKKKKKKKKSFIMIYTFTQYILT